MRLKGKTAIVTGGASGFGYGITRQFVAEGAKVILADLNAELGPQLAEELGPNAVFVQADVTSAEDWAQMVDSAQNTFGGLDIVVNNAGYTHVNQPMLDVDEAEFDQVYAVNVKALYLSARATLPIFRAQKQIHADTDIKGVILNIASTAGVRPRPGLVWYNSSKAAAIGVTRSMAVELAPERIRVNAINPVAGDTPLLAKFMGEDSAEKRAQFKQTIPLGRLSTPDDIASAAVYLCSNEASLVTGLCMEVDGGRTV